jgi:preprotein translocase subunit YajC
MGPLLALLVTFGLMWALLILPQQRRMRQHTAVISTLRVGDEVVTAGGVYGTVTSVDEDTLGVEVAPGIVLRVLRNAVSQRIAPEGEDDGEDIDEPVGQDVDPVVDATLTEDEI